MKFNIFLALSLFLLFSPAISVPVSDDEADPPPPPQPNGGQMSEKARGKQRATSPAPGQAASAPPSAPPSRAPTPRWPDDPNAPLPGRSDVYTKDGNAHTYWGDDHLPGHMNHLDRYKERFPNQQRPQAFDPKGSRDESLKNIGTGPVDPVTGLRKVKDEKSLSSLKKAPGDKTSVEWRDALESGPVKGVPSRKGVIDTEAKLTGKLKTELKSKDPNSAKTATLHSNPGWNKAPAPGQRRAHSAPPDIAGGPRKTPGAPGTFSRKLPQGSRDRQPTVKNFEPTRQPNNLRPSTPPPPAGQVWRPGQRSDRGAAHGAPARPSDREGRQPPRPQNANSERPTPRPSREGRPTDRVTAPHTQQRGHSAPPAIDTSRGPSRIPRPAPLGRSGSSGSSGSGPSQGRPPASHPGGRPRSPSAGGGSGSGSGGRPSGPSAGSKAPASRIPVPVRKRPSGPRANSKSPPSRLPVRAKKTSRAGIK